MIKTIIILMLAGGLQVKQFVVDGDLKKYDGVSVTTKAEENSEKEKLSDELFSLMYKLDEKTNQNVLDVEKLTTSKDNFNYNGVIHIIRVKE